MNVLSMVCKTCSRILFGEEERAKFLKQVRNPRLDNIQRNELLKKILKAAKKKTLCDYCGAFNGDIKKVSALKLVHRKFKTKASAGEKEAWEQEFADAIQYNPEIATYLSKTHEDMSPIRVMKVICAAFAFAATSNSFLAPDF
jgi:DNA-directed RNA polymerase III subunit RPC1